MVRFIQALCIVSSIMFFMINAKTSYANELLVSCKNGNRQHMGIVDTNVSGYQDLFGEKVKIKLSNDYLTGYVKTEHGDKQFFISLKTNAFSQNNGEIDPYIICGVKKLGIADKAQDFGDPNVFKYDRNDPPWWYQK